MTIVRVPASTANLGPGFDALGMALSITADIGVLDADTTAEDRSKAVDDDHPAAIAFARAGGRGRLWVRSPIPMARGLGYSGAMRAGGCATALAQTLDGDAAEFAARRRDALTVAGALEGHADNAAASLLGGVTATDGHDVVSVPMAIEPDVVVWIPPSATSTSASRTALPASVPMADAVHNIAKTAMLVAALAAGDVAALRSATADRLHQVHRFTDAEPSRAALACGLEAGAWCGWLSGSGPTIALLAAPGTGADLAAALPAAGQTKLLTIHRPGTTLVDGH